MKLGLLLICSAAAAIVLPHEAGAQATPFACTYRFLGARLGSARERIRRYGLFIQLCQGDARVATARRQIARLRPRVPPHPPVQQAQVAPPSPPMVMQERMPAPSPESATEPPSAATSAVVVLDGSGNDGARTMAEALRMVRDGGVIRVRPGRYRENVLITKPVTVVVDRDSGSRPVFDGLVIDAVGTVRLEGIRIEGDGTASAMRVQAGTVELIDSEVLNPGAGRRGRIMTSALFVSGGDVRIDGGTIGPGGDAAILIQENARLTARASAVIDGRAGYGLYATGRADVTLTRTRISGESAILANGRSRAQLNRNELIGTPDHYVVSIAEEASAEIFDNHFFVSRGRRLTDATPENWLEAPAGPRVTEAGNKRGSGARLRRPQGRRN